MIISITNLINLLVGLDRSRRRLLCGEFKADTLNIPLLHMWDDVNYNTEHPYSSNGIQFHTRINNLSPY